MAQAVHAQEARRRTLTVYTDVRRVTDALAIVDTDTVTVLLIDSDGWPRCGSGQFPAALLRTGTLDSLPPVWKLTSRGLAGHVYWAMVYPFHGGHPMPTPDPARPSPCRA
jgi:hypothetical protein